MKRTELNLIFAYNSQKLYKVYKISAEIIKYYNWFKKHTLTCNS